MDRLSRSIEALKIQSSTAASASDGFVVNKEKIGHFNTITELLCSPALSRFDEKNKANNDNYFKFLTTTFEILFPYCDDNDYDLRLAAEDNITKLVKNLKENHLIRIQVELHRIIKRNNDVGPRALKGALWRFAELAHLLHPKKIRPFFEHLYPSFCSIATRTEDIVHDKLPDYYELIFRTLGPSISDKEIKDLFLAYLKNMSHESALIRRSSASCLIIMCRYSRYPLANIRYLITYAIDQLLEYHQQSDSLRLINGYLVLIKNLIQLLGINIDEFLRTSNQIHSSLNLTKTHDINEQYLPINIRQITECMDMVCYLCLQHSDHNVVSSSLETLEILLKYANLFDFDQLLISTEHNSIEQTRVYEKLKNSNSNYQRSFIDNNEQIIVNNEENDSMSTINNEKRTSAGKLVEQLISKYILNSDGTIKSNEESRISIKGATLTCLSYLATIDPFAFFDSFDYPTEIITYLLTLHEHSDPHLSGACANLLAKLIQTTVRLLTISPSISALTSSFNNQSSLLSTDSQDSSRLDIQLGILNELLSTYRLCLNDSNPRVVHISLNALRSLLPTLLLNNQALTTIALQLLEDAVQHSTSSYVLTKVAIAQLIGDIDFRILTYLEQQQQVKKTNRSWLDRCIDTIFLFLTDEDSRVRQVAASTYAKFIDHSSFLPNQWPIHSLFKWINSSCQWIYQLHHTYQQINTTTKEILDENVSYLTTLIFDRLAQASSRIQIVGCLEGILALVNSLNSQTIRSFFHYQYDELRLLVHFFKHPFILHELNNLQLLLEIICSIFSKLTSQSNEISELQITEKIFHFLIKILSIFACVIEDTSPPVPATTTKLPFPPIPSSPSQTKKRSETTTDSTNTKESSNSDVSNPLMMSKDTSMVSSTSSDREKKLRTQLGAFGNNPSMMKLFELIRSSYQTHKTTLNSNEIDRFSQLLSVTLDTLKAIINIVSIQDLSRHLDETLNYLKSTFTIEKIKTIQCTQEFLQNLHQLVSNSTNPVETKHVPTVSQSPTNLHTITIRQPMIYLFGSQHTRSVNSDQSVETSAIRDFYLTIKQRQTIEHLNHPPNKNERSRIGSYIRSFEAIVILSLKKYFISNEIEFHAVVLDLLVQLLLLRVNYSLLDADEHFLNHIISQLESIEDMKSGFTGSPFFIYHTAEFLMTLSLETFNSKQVIKIQDLIKHCDALNASGHEPETHALSALEPVVYDLFLVRNRTENKELEAQRTVIVQILLKLIRYNKALQLLILIVDSARNEVDKWKRLSRQIIDVIVLQLQSNTFLGPMKGQPLLDIYATQLTLFDVVSTVALRPIDPFITAFRSLVNRSDIDRHSINRWLMHINLLLRCIIQNSTEDAIIARWQDAANSSTTNLREETFSGALVRILYELVERLLTFTRQLRGDIDEILVNLLSDYLYLLIYILENAKQFRVIVHDFRQLLLHDETDETVHRLDTFSYLNLLSEYFKLLSTFSISLLLQWTHILNILDYTQESWWSSMLTIPTPISPVTHLSLTGQLQSYCDLICRHELYVEHLTSILTHRYLLYLLFEQSDTCSYVHNLFGLIHRTSVASHLFVESIYTNWEHLLKTNPLLLSLKILRTLESIHLDESGLLLVLLIEQFLTLPYLAVLRLAELIICRRIEMMLTFDENTLNQQLMPKYLPLILQNLSKQNQANLNKHDIKSNEHLYALIQRLITKINYDSQISFERTKQQEFEFSFNSNDEDFILNWIKHVHCPIDVTPKIYAQMLKNVAYKKLLPFMMSPDFIWLSMPDCLLLGISIPSLWRASTGAFIKKINDLCFSLPTQRLILNDINNLIDEEPTPDTIYIKSLFSCSINQSYLIALIDSISIYFETIQTHTDLACQFSSGDIRDLLRFLIYIAEFIYFNLINKKTSYFNWNLIESFFHCLTKTISNSTSILLQLLIASDQITSCCILAKSILSIYEYIFQRQGLVILDKQSQEYLQSYLNLIEPDNRPYTQILIQTFNDLNRLYNLTKKIRLIPLFYRKYLHTIAILLFRLPIFNSFIRIPIQFWQQNHSNMKLQFHSNDYCLSTFPNDLLQHSDIMLDYIERISYVGWLSRTQFQEIWVTFLAAINSTRNDENNPEQEHISKEEILENNATQCIWIRGVTTFLLNALRLNSIGNPADRHFEHHSRNRTIPFLSNEQGGKYIQTCSTIGISSKRMITNLERLVTNDFLSHGQLSYDTILTSIQSNNTSPLPVNSLFDRLFSRHGLDINSSLQILIEIYVGWLTQNPNQLCLQLKFELIRSFIYLSDLFTSSQQLTNLYDLCNDYYRTWFEEDDLFMSLVNYGLCKSGVLLGHINKESNEIYMRIIERNWKYLSKTFGYSSCLFLLESHEDDLNKILLPNLIQEIKNDMQTKISPMKFNLDIRLNGLILANVFYLIENNHTNANDFLPLLFDDEYFDTNDYLTQDMISIGLERLLLLGQYPKNDIWKLYKRSITSLRQPTGLNLNQLILILARIYTYENNQNSNTEILYDEQEMRDSLTMNTSSSLDNILIELVGELYERTKQTYILPYEALLLLRPLPSLLSHMGLSDRLMNKIVVEFAASPQQLYPQILAYIVFAVFRILISSYYSAKVNEWTLLSMTSVAQRKPIRMAIWGLTCLMLSACSSYTIADSLFPLALSRFSARFEELDNRLFLLAGREYYHQLNNVEQRRQFEQAFQNESNNEKIYADLLAHIRDTISSSS